jgi:hypothetical protein
MERQLHVAQSKGCTGRHFSLSRYPKPIDEGSVRGAEIENEPRVTLSNQGGVRRRYALVLDSHIVVLAAADGCDWPVDPELPPPQ